MNALRKYKCTAKIGYLNFLYAYCSTQTEGLKLPPGISQDKSREHSLKKLEEIVGLKDPVYHLLWIFILSYQTFLNN